MAMLSSYTTLLNRATLPGKFSYAAAVQPHKQPPPAVALPWVPFKQSRAPLVVRRANGGEEAAISTPKFNIPPGALVHPSPTSDGDKWRITEDKDHVSLKFNVGELTRKEKLEVFIEDQVLLTIRYKDDGGEKNSPASGLDVRLLMPLGYDPKKVKAAIVPDGWLQITIAKPKAQKPEKIQISE